MNTSVEPTIDQLRELAELRGKLIAMGATVREMPSAGGLLAYMASERERVRVLSACRPW